MATKKQTYTMDDYTIKLLEEVSKKTMIKKSTILQMLVKEYAKSIVKKQ